MKKVLIVAFIACQLTCCIASADPDPIGDILRMAELPRAEERVVAACALPDIACRRGVAAVRPYYRRLLNDSDENVVTEMLAGIKRTPCSVVVGGTEEKTVGLLRELRPRIEELCRSSNKITAQIAGEALEWVKQIEKEDN